MCGTAHWLTYQALKISYLQWPAVPYSFQTAEWGTAEARACILKTYPKYIKKEKKSPTENVEKLPGNKKALDCSPVIFQTVKDKD